MDYYEHDCINNAKPTALKTVEMLLSNKKIDTFLAKFCPLRVKTVKIMCHCPEYPEYSGSYVINNVKPTALKTVKCYFQTKILTLF